MNLRFLPGKKESQPRKLADENRNTRDVIYFISIFSHFFSIFSRRPPVHPTPAHQKFSQKPTWSSSKRGMMKYKLKLYENLPLSRKSKRRLHGYNPMATRSSTAKIIGNKTYNPISPSFRLSSCCLLVTKSRNPRIREKKNKGKPKNSIGFQDAPFEYTLLTQTW